MFTGIIEGLGKIIKIIRKSNEIIFRIEPCFNMEEFKVGESISVNGVCLTVTNYGEKWFEVYVSPETFAKTNLVFLKFNSLVNLERALLVGARLGGHFVTGHVDTTGLLCRIEKNSRSTKLLIKIDKECLKLIVNKGSISLDGVSLTVNECGTDFITVNVIPETLKRTSMINWRVNYKMNIEVDLIVKHINKLCGVK